MAKEDYYQTLGVSKDASASEIKKAYKVLAMKHHPDRAQDDPESETKFKQINEAYKVLSDPDQRGRYDQFGHAGLEGGTSGFSDGESPFGDIFGDVFSDFFGGGRNSGRGRDLQYAMEITLEEAVAGIKKTVKLTKNQFCKNCRGTGAKDGKSFTECHVCGGRGQVRIQQSFFSVQQTCPECRGAGKKIETPCNSCSGRGTVRGSKTLNISIPAGVEDGDRMRLSGEGEAGRSGSSAGDLYVDIRVKKHPIFARDGSNLSCEIPVSFATLALGGEFQAPTLQGKVSLKIPEGTNNGKVFRLRGKGVKNLRGHSVGDLLIKLQAEIPVKLNAEQKELLSKFEQSLKKGGAKHSPASSSWLDSVKRFFDP